MFTLYNTTPRETDTGANPRTPDTHNPQAGRDQQNDNAAETKQEQLSYSAPRKAPKFRR